MSTLVNVSLQDAISRSDLTLPQIDQILSKSQASVDFWGTRKVTAEGFEGSVRMVDVARRLLDFSDAGPEKHFTLEERKAGVRSLKKMEQHYEETDQMQSSSNPLTYIFVFFQKLLGMNGESFIPYNERWFIQYDWEASSRFQGYTNYQFYRDFPGQPLPKEHFSAGKGTFYIVPLKV
jgi:hypothetical protein